MFKPSLVIAFLAGMALIPAYAAPDLCNDAHMKKMDDMVAKMTDAAKKKEAITYQHVEGCDEEGRHSGMHKHTEEAHKAMGL